MRYHLWCAALALSSATLGAQVPAGWKIVRSPKPLVDHGQAPGVGGQCQAALPGDWVPGLHFQWATNMKAPPGADRGTVELRELSPSRSFADAKKDVAQFNNPTTVFEDSGKRYWYKSLGSNTLFTVWVVVVAGHPSCVASISYTTPAMQSLVRQIALSVAPAK